MTIERWRSSERLAWTERDGFPPPPRGANVRLMAAIAGAMTAIWVGVISTDALCPDHRAWVETLACIAAVCGVASIVGLLGQRSWAPFTALLGATLGVSVGLIDTVHDTTRGALISLGFALVSVFIVFLSLPWVRALRWEARARADLHVDDVADLAGARAIEVQEPTRPAADTTAGEPAGSHREVRSPR